MNRAVRVAWSDFQTLEWTPTETYQDPEGKGAWPQEHISGMFSLRMAYAVGGGRMSASLCRRLHNNLSGVGRRLLCAT